MLETRDFEMGIKENRLGYREWAISTHQSNVEAMDWLWHDSILCLISLWRALSFFLPFRL
jgi:hypothetical protein